MSWPLDGVVSKLRGAKRNMYRFRDAYEGIRRADPIKLRLVDEDAQAGRYIVQVDHFPELVLDLGVIVGDAVHCFRSALDQLVSEAARQQTGRISSRTQFPITDDAAEFRKQQYRISDLTPDQQAIVEWSQPYNRAGEQSPLLALRGLSNTDKHRVLNPMLTEGAIISEAAEPFRGLNCTVVSHEWIGTGHRLTVGANVARLELRGEHHEPIVNMEGAFIPDVVFEDRGDP